MNILHFIPQVSAQSDAISQPTFGSIDVGGGQTTTAQVLITSDSSEVEVGDQFTVRVEVRTSDIQINEYNIVLEYNPNVLSVIDQNSTVNGTQVELLDTVFSTSDIATDNIVDTAAGEITLNAAISAGSGLSVNRSVVEVTFQAQAISSSTLQIKEGVDGTQLIRPSGQTLTFTTNQRTIDVVAQTGGGDIPTTPTEPTTPTTPSTPTNPTTPVVDQIPDTAITDSLSGSIGLGIGLVLIFVGIWLAFKRGKSQKEKD